MTVMKYGAGATSLNSTVRSSSARTPIALLVVASAKTVVLSVLEHEVDPDTDPPGCSGFRTRLTPYSTSCAVKGVPVRPAEPVA